MKREKDRVDIKTLQVRMLIVYVVVSFFSIYTISTIIINISNKILSDKVSSLVSANCHQIELNTNNYFNNVESITTLLFADEKYYKFDPIAEAYNEYSQIKSEEDLTNRIEDLGLMQNFTDFAVVYSDGRRVGWTSNTTIATFDTEELYGALEGAITNDKTNDGWAFGLGGITDRLFYIKRLNKNAVLMTAFYSRELETAFDYPAELEGMVINLVNQDNTILYSSQTDKIAKTLDNEVVSIINGNESDIYIANANGCENGWSVVCAVPCSYIMKEENALKKDAVMLSFLVASIMIVSGLTIISIIFKPVGSAVEELKEEAVRDKLSGLLNKQSFNDKVQKKLSGAAADIVRTFVMIDVDNFKQINDNLGHAYGDEFIVRMAQVVSSQFGDDYVVGRVGGDEFAIYREAANENVEQSTETIVDRVKGVFAAFDKEFIEEKTKVNVSLSIGIAVMNDERRFENIYKAADEALYISKKSGKNRYTLYGEVGK